jgi:hypothetical protein
MIKIERIRLLHKPNIYARINSAKHAKKQVRRRRLGGIRPSGVKNTLTFYDMFTMTKL